MNKNLNVAKRKKNDEFYTQLTDIEKEVCNYKEHFVGKTVLCNCDKVESAFNIYFSQNFQELGLKRLLISACDFRSEECIGLLKEADIVVTNPPFSLFREYVAQLVEYDKKFLIIGNMNAIIFKEVFPLIKDNRIWFGINTVKEFETPAGEVRKFGNVLWFTNLSHKKCNEELILTQIYKGNEKDYPKYNNYDAINVDRVKDIPKDYDGVMGVPITFLYKYNQKQFELVNLKRGWIGDYVGGRKVYVRILIKRRIR